MATDPKETAELKTNCAGMMGAVLELGIMRLSVLTISCVLVACSSSGVVPVGDDTYMIAKRSGQVGIGPPVKTEAAVYEEAAAFCASQSKVVETIEKDVRNTVPARPGSVNLKFRCVDKAISAESPAQSESSEVVAADGKKDDMGGKAESDDIYSKILKLDDLRQRGLITDEEYEQEKKELLDAN